MRMWMVNPRILCRKHLLGEYRELFTLIGSMRRGISLQGWIDHNCLELSSIKKRYTELRKEMLRRHYKPSKPFAEDTEIKSLIKQYDPAVRNCTVDRAASKRELIRRCPDCAARSK